MSSTTSPMPTISSYFDNGTLSASAALAWKFYAFGMLAIFITGILGTVSTASCGDIEASTAASGNKSTNKLKSAESCDESMTTSTIPTFALSSSSVTLISTPPKAYTAARGEGSAREPRGIDARSCYPTFTPAHISEEARPYGRQ
ncbi:hypothetical protein BD779DRAFT_1495750 [Infundibulicybe gibba]|nr:hypothetical protein BD779DRAFT_1495750 [Infundibulicybe gibba]